MTSKAKTILILGTLLATFIGNVGTASAEGNKTPLELRFGTKDNLVELGSAGSAPPRTYLHVTAKSATDQALPEATIKIDDRPLPNAKGEIKFKTVGLASSDPKQPVWVVEVDATNWPANSLQERVALVTLGSLQQLHRFQVTNQPAAALDVSVDAPAGLWKLNDSGPVSIDIRAGTQAFGGVRVARSTLVNVNGDRIDVGQLRLCVDAKCKATLADDPWSAEQNRTLFIDFVPGVGSIEPGRYTGSVTLSFAGRRDRKDVSLELAHSPDWIRNLGMGTVALGIVLAFFATVVRPLKVQRLNAERAVLALRGRLDELRAEVNDAVQLSGVPLPLLNSRLTAWDNTLTLQSLRQDLPPKSLWDAARKFDAAALATKLTEHEPKLSSLAILITEGLRPLSKMAAQGTRPDVVEAIKVLDVFVETSTIDVTRALVTSAWVKVVQRKLELTLSTMRHPAVVAIDRVELQLSVWSTWYWVLMLVLAWTGACALVIWSNPSFGLWQDLLWCLFWGFGLPTSLDKLKELSPGSFAMPVSIALPKI